MDILNLQKIINFVIDSNKNNSISISLLNSFIKDNNHDINMYTFLYENLINHNINCDINDRMVIKGRLYPTGVTVNYLILLFCLYDKEEYLESIYQNYEHLMMRQEFKEYVRKCLLLEINNKKWIAFKNKILIKSMKEISKEEFNVLINKINNQKTTIHNKQTIKKTEEEPKIDKMKLLEDKIDSIEKRLF